MGTRRGQTMLEYAMVVMAVGLGVAVMAGYMKRALKAGAKSLETQLNGATVENRPL